MKKIFTLLCFITVVSVTYAQQKVYQLGSVNNDMLRKMAFDKEGNIIITGSFEDTASFAGVKFTSLNRNATGTDSKTSLDVFILKMDKAGKVLWHKNFGGHFKSYPNQVAVDENDNIILAGQFTEKFTTGQGDTLRGLNGWNAFYLKLNKNGELVWQKSVESKKLNEVTDLEINKNGEIFSTINNRDTFFIDGESYFLNKALSAILKIGTDGKLIWCKIPNRLNIEHKSPYTSTVLTSNIDNNTILPISTGKGALYLNDKKILDEDTMNRMLLLSLDDNGDVIWKNTAYMKESSTAYFSKQDKNGSIYTMGYFIDAVQFDNIYLTAQRNGTSSDYDTYLAKYNKEGKISWAKSMGVKGDINLPNALTVDENGNVYIANQYDNNYNLFDTTLKTGAMTDIYIARISPDGNLEKIISTKGGSTASIASPRDILISPEGTLYVAGVFNYVTTFGGTTLQSKSRDDGFLWVIPEFTVGMEEAAPQSRNILQVYPNPSAGKFNISLKNASANAATLKVYSITGQEVYTQSLQAGTLNHTILLESQPKGIYFVKFNDGKTAYTEKIVVQ